MDSTKRDELRRQLDTHRTAAEALIRAADNAARDFTPDENRQWEEHMRQAEIANKLLTMHDQRLLLEGHLRSVQGAPVPNSTGMGSTASADPIRDMLDSNELQADFDIVRGMSETRAIADFSDNASMYTADFAQNVAIYMRTESPWLNLASVIHADNGRPLVVGKITADPTGYTPGEGTAITESTPTLGSAQVTLVSYKALSYVSWEAYEDAEYNLSDALARTAARQLSLNFGTDATTTILAGINNGGTASGVGGNGTATITFAGYEDLLDLKYGRAAPYRAHGAWVFSNSALKKARKFRDGQGQYLWSPAISSGQPPTFDGDPVYESPELSSVGSASKSFTYGDFASALIIKAMPLRVAVSSDFRYNQDQIAFKTVLRAGLAVQDPAAAAFLVSANS